MWQMTEDRLESIAVGAGILGTGGGGNPYRGKLIARRHLREGRSVVIVDPHEVPDAARIVSVGGMGAPVIGIERIIRGDEALCAMRALEQFIGTPFDFIIPGEVGGGNSTIPMVVGALSGLPVIDADGMGRAFPELQMSTFAVYGGACTPAALCDYKHNTVLFPNSADARTLERQARAVTVTMGGAASFALSPMSGAEMRTRSVLGTLSFAEQIGAAVRRARVEHQDPVDAAAATAGGDLLFGGKVVDVQRRLVAGFARGSTLIEGFAEWRGQALRIDFQNENLIARDADGAVVATVPDLICILDSTSGEPVTTELIRYGLRVSVLGIPAPSILTAPEGLAVFGPRAFGYDVAYFPLPGRYAAPSSSVDSLRGGAMIEGEVSAKPAGEGVLHADRLEAGD
jgi:DUF917 family protein